MRLLPLLALTALPLLAQAPEAPSSRAITNGQSSAAFALVAIPREVTVLEEASLLFYSQMLSGAQEEIVPGGQVTGQNGDASDGNLPIGARMTDMKETSPSAYRAYAFVLEPKENLKFHLKCGAHGKVVMRFLPRLKQDAMTGQVRKANNAPAPVRASRIEITNVTEARCSVALLLYGEAENPFRLEIERKPGK